jgi:NADPH:quinone reductase
LAGLVCSVVLIRLGRALVVEAARRAGANVVSNARKRAAVLAPGADHAIDYTEPSWPRAEGWATGGAGADLLLEMTGGNTMLRALHALAPFGRMVVYGLAGRRTVPIDLQRLVQAAEAHRLLESRQTVGKLVLIP